MEIQTEIYFKIDLFLNLYLRILFVKLFSIELYILWAILMTCSLILGPRNLDSASKLHNYQSITQLDIRIIWYGWRRYGKSFKISTCHSYLSKSSYEKLSFWQDFFLHAQKMAKKTLFEMEIQIETFELWHCRALFGKLF